jgi:hypothetical protein
MENVSGTVCFVDMSRCASMDEGRATVLIVGKQTHALMVNVSETVGIVEFARYAHMDEISINAEIVEL